MCVLNFVSPRLLYIAVESYASSPQKDAPTCIFTGYFRHSIDPSRLGSMDFTVRTPDEIVVMVTTNSVLNFDSLENSFLCSFTPYSCLRCAGLVIYLLPC